jgi:hypothetical protein
MFQAGAETTACSAASVEGGNNSAVSNEPCHNEAAASQSHSEPPTSAADPVPPTSTADGLQLREGVRRRGSVQNEAVQWNTKVSIFRYSKTCEERSPEERTPVWRGQFV